jgi:hypothetical protein
MPIHITSYFIHSLNIYRYIFSVYNVLRRLPISIFHCLLSLHCSSLSPLCLNSSRMPSVQLRLGLPFLLLPCGVHNSTCFGILSLSIRTTCPYHLSWLVLMSSTIVVLTFMMSLILSFLIRSLLDLPADLLQKSISVVRSMFSDVFFSGHISLLYVTIICFKIKNPSLVELCWQKKRNP